MKEYWRDLLAHRMVLEMLRQLGPPIQGKYARENVRKVAALLWELAFKLKENEVIITHDA